MADDQRELLARVQRLEDLEAVRATWLDYCNRLDSADMERLGDVFTEDARLEMVGLGANLDGTYEGRRPIIEDFYRRTGSAASGSGATRLMTGHLSTNMQIDLAGDEATTLAYFFEIVDDNLVLIGTYQHRMRRCPDRWRFAFLRITVRYRGRLQIDQLEGRSLREIIAKPV
jgi:hypothetical protein